MLWVFSRRTVLEGCEVVELLEDVMGRSTISCKRSGGSEAGEVLHGGQKADLGISLVSVTMAALQLGFFHIPGKARTFFLYIRS